VRAIEATPGRATCASCSTASSARRSWPTAGKDNDDGAIEAYRKAIAVDAQYLPAYIDLISVLQGRKDTAGMKAVLADAKKALPGRLAVALAEAQVVYSEGDLRRTRELLQGVLQSSRDNIRALQMVGLVELASGSFNQAETYFSRVLQLAPDSVNARRMLALTYVRSGQPAKALGTLQPLLDARSPKADVLAMAAEANLQAGNAARAESLYQQAARINPDDPQVRTALAMTRITRGDAAAGFAELEALAAQDPTPQGSLTVISAHVRKGDTDAALKAIDRLEAKHPEQPIAHDMRGRVLLTRKDTAGARASFEKAVAMRADYFPAAESLAALDLGENKLEQAKARFEAMLKVDPKYLRATLALAELNARMGTPKADIARMLTAAIQTHPTEAPPRLMLAELHLAHDEVKSALSVAQDASTTIPDDPRVLDVLGRAQWKAGETQQATTTFRKASVIDPKQSLPYLRLAALYQATDNATAAMQNYRRALEVAPGHALAQQGVVDLAIKTKSYDEAMALASAVQRQQPRDGIGHSLEGDVLAAQKKWSAAVPAYRQAVQKSPSTDVAIKLHTALVQLRQRAEAEGFAKSWRTSHPRDARFVMHLGDVALVGAELPAAEAFYTEVLALQPNNDVAMNNLAWLLMRQNKPGALEYAQKANTLSPDKPQFMDTLASVLAADKQFAKALELQKKVVSLAPDYNNGRLNLARIAIQAGDTRLAKAELEKLSWLGDKFPAQSEVVQLLKGVQ
jgi:cellulose synthase operon protein C